MTASDLSTTVTDLYHQLLAAWNRRDATAMAELFARDGHAIGFDGSEMHGPEQIASTLVEIFAGHETAGYVDIVEGVWPIGVESAMLVAHVGMVPPGGTLINSTVNAVQTMIASRDSNGAWTIRLLQSTPAAYHGRPDDAARLTAELQARADARAS